MSSTTDPPGSPSRQFELVRADVHSWGLSVIICLLVLLFFVASCSACWHWYVIPVFFCGVLLMRDLVAWLSGQVELFDPVGLLGAFGTHLFFLAPLLHVYWDSWLHYFFAVDLPSDWRPWLGYMAFLNLLGLLIYRMVRKAGTPPPPPASLLTAWRLRPERVPLVFGGAIGIGTLLELWTLRHFGGVGGIILAYSNRAEGEAFGEMGRLFMVSEAVPLLAMILYAIYAQRRRVLASWPILIGVILLFFGAQMLFGGLRGSRSNTLYAMVWVIGIMHLTVRRLSVKLISTVGLVLLVSFLYGYGIYKGGGAEAVQDVTSGRMSLSSMAETTHRDFRSTLLGDLGRADIQAFLLYRLSRERTFHYGWGRSYLASLAILVPRSLWPNRPKGKGVEGTALEYGPGTMPEGMYSSRVYGLQGEALLNFGPMGVPLAFLGWGLLIRAIRRRIRSGQRQGTLIFLAPFLVTLCLVTLLGNADNALFYTFKNGSIPFLILYLVSTKEKRLPAVSNTVED